MKKFGPLLLILFLLVCPQAKEAIDLVWSRSYDKPLTGFSLTPQIIFLGLPDRVVGVDYSGLQRWSYITNSEVSLLGGHSNSVFTYLSDGSIIHLSGEGKVLNLFNIPSAVAFPQSFSGTDVGYFFGAQNGAAYFYDINGSLRFSFQTDGYVIATHITPNGFIVISDKRIYLLNSSFDLVSKSLDHNFIRIAHISGNYIVCATNDGRIHLYERDLDYLWNMSTDSAVGALVMKNQTLLAGTQIGKILHLHVNGSLLDEFSLPSPVVSADLNENFFVSASLDNEVFFHNKEGVLVKKIQLQSTPLHLRMSSDKVLIATDEAQLNYFKVPGHTMHAVIFVLVVFFSLSLIFLFSLRNW